MVLQRQDARRGGEAAKVVKCPTLYQACPARGQDTILRENCTESRGTWRFSIILSGVLTVLPPDIAMRAWVCVRTCAHDKGPRLGVGQSGRETENSVIRLLQRSIDGTAVLPPEKPLWDTQDRARNRGAGQQFRR